MMVECEHGMEERSLGGQINLARGPAQSPAAAQGSSYFNRQEAILAIRYDRPEPMATHTHSLDAHLA